MKVHYINILLFYLPLNILLTSLQVNVHKYHYNTTLHTKNNKPTKSHRLLCECDIYTSVYDKDPEMKRVMQQFDERTSERFHEYDERIEEKRKKCKEQCEKDIQKIILKDKIEKELTEKLEALETNIKTEDILTCVCEKSVADKVEKTCLKCGGVLGGGVAPSLGLLGGIGGLVISNWTNTPFYKAFVAFAKKEGIAAGTKAGDAAGVAKVIELVKSEFDVSTVANNTLGSIFNAKNYADEALITKSVYFEFEATCFSSGSENKFLCFFGSKDGLVPGTGASAKQVIGTTARKIVKQVTTFASEAADEAAKETTNRLIEAEVTKITSAGTNLYTGIVYSVTAILIIVLVMVIIYLILRYRRKKKMKKKLQYIKLLKE